MKTITLEVSDATAERLDKMSAMEKKSISKAMDILVGKRSLEEIMADISEQAKRNGLTPEILEQILKEIDEERA